MKKCLSILLILLLACALLPAAAEETPADFTPAEPDLEATAEAFAGDWICVWAEVRGNLFLAETDLEVAKLQLERSEIDARRVQVLGEADVRAAYLRSYETARGAELRAQALGSTGIMAELDLVEKLNPALKLHMIYAGEGTLWTDLKSGAVNLLTK